MPICKTFNAEVGFFERLDVIHELLEEFLHNNNSKIWACRDVYCLVCDGYC